VAWESYPEYLDALEQGGLGVNVASFIGHSAIRLHVMGASALEREATSEERAQMAALVREGVAAGALGWSTSFAPTHFFATTTSRRRAASPRARSCSSWRPRCQSFDRGVIELAPKLIVGST
jgi:N-acyl-D-aspartate/D-glutamate deacylase